MFYAIMFQYGQITPQLAIKVLLQFDKAINQALATRVRSRLTFKVCVHNYAVIMLNILEIKCAINFKSSVIQYL